MSDDDRTPPGQPQDRHLHESSFSEDLDFTAVDAGPEEPFDLQRIFADVGEWLQEEAGIELSSTTTRSPLELLRYAGANRLCAEIDYRPEQGRSGPRVVEPYALRRTSEGNIVLFVINDRRQLRSYRVDRIAGIKPTTQTFMAVRRVEF